LVGWKGRWAGKPRSLLLARLRRLLLYFVRDHF
jgi:hypothetical protein